VWPASGVTPPSEHDGFLTLPRSDVEVSPRPTREWVVKASKFCNLRCSYCYEWNELSKRGRMSLTLWEKLFETIKALEETAGSAGREPLAETIVWHGGEPSVLPLDYLESVMALEHAIFPPSWHRNGWIRNRLQSNLYSLPDEKIDFLKDNHFEVGVSFDVVPGGRLNLRGEPTEERVLANMQRLRARGIDPQCTVVIAGHTARSIERVYDYLRNEGRGCRVLPLFEGPAERPLAAVTAEAGDVNRALMRLFELWFEDGCPFPIRPLDQYLTMAVMKMLGLRRDFVYDRRAIGDRIVIVELDGTLYEPGVEASRDFALGNLRTQTIEEIVDSAAYRRSLERNDDVIQNVCRSCEYFPVCGGTEMFMLNDGGAKHRTCMTAQPLLRSIESYLQRQGIDAGALQGYMPDALYDVGYA
jgi:uncharacterized protein